MTDGWRRELWRLAGVLGAALALGLLYDRPFILLFAGCVIYLLVTLHNLYRVEQWIHAGRDRPSPDSGGVVGDIVQQVHRLQRRNRERERRLGDILKQFHDSTQALPNATVVLNRSLEIQWLNEAASRLLGLSAKRDLGLRVDNILRGPVFRDYVAAGNFDKAIEIASPIREGHALSVRLVPFGDGQLLLIAQDITERRQLEEMRRDFVANASHELRTPLTVISGYLERMVEADGERPLKEWARPLASMLRQGRRMRKIIEDLLLLARLEDDTVAESRESVAVAELIRDIVDEMAVIAEQKHQSIRVDADDGLCIAGNRDELRVAFSNLVQNAVRYTDEGGHVEVRWRRQDGVARFEVRDDGPGIAPHHVPRLTERFYRVDVGRSRATGGTGLGLAIVKHALERHGSTVQVESEVGRGSRFWCDFDADRLV
jgi:two-component system phosphate regulon sensor histidine kinase PhoR